MAGSAGQAPARARSRREAKVAAARLPVARVAVDVSLPHLDRPFDYRVPEPLSAAAVPGCRVRVRFAGRLTGGYLLQRTEASEHQGQLAFLERVVSPEPVLTAEVFGLARAVADRYGGTLADVLRLAIPPRHAAVESAPPTDVPPWRPALPEPGPWARYPAGRSFLSALAGGRAPRAAWSALPGPHCRRARCAGHRSGRQRPGPGRRGAGRRPGPGPARLPRGRPRPRRALPALARGRARPGAGGGRDPVRDVRPRRRARAGRDLG